MNNYTAFDERRVCLNCPKKRCIFERKQGGSCPLIKEKRDEHRREQEAKKRKKA